MCGVALRVARYRRLFFSALAALLVVFGTAFALSGDAWQKWLIDENGLTESLSALFWFLTCFAGMPAALHAGKRWLLPLPILGLLGGLDEVSYSIPFLTEPESITVDNQKIDGLHDSIAFVMKEWAASGSLGAYIAGSVTLGLAAGLAIVFRKRYMPRIMAWCRMYPPLDFLRYAVILVAISMILDLQIIDSGWAWFVEEMFEMFGGMAMFVGALLIYITPVGGIPQAAAPNDSTPGQDKPASVNDG